MAVALLCFASVLCVSVYSVGYDTVGTVTPYNEEGVLPSINNKNEYADYVFKFMLDNSLAKGSRILITFPEQYDTNLGIAGSPDCTGGTCSLAVRTVTITTTADIAA
jgi:hypothetical protein